MIMRLLWPKILISVVTCLLVGFIGGISTADALTTWYPSLVKPSFNPPDWIFAPVWTTLYIMMGISVGLVWHGGWEKREVQNAVMTFLAQLVFNGLWSVVFFGMRSPGGALIIIVILWLLIVRTVRKFHPINRISAYLLIPYLLWVTFALVLNFSIYWLNQA